MDFFSDFSTTTNADAQGQWVVTAGEAIPPGFHQVVVTDADGNQTITPVFLEGASEEIIIVRDQPVWFERVQNILPPAYAYAILGLLLLLIVSTRMIFWIGDRAERRNPGRKRVFQWLAVGLVVLIIGSASLGALILNRQLPESPAAFPGVPTSIQATTSPVDARGSVVAPFGMAPISGVDLTLGETSIRTSGSGQFAFSNARVGDTIRISHPLLKRAFVWRLGEAKPLVIPFDVALYNAMNTSMEAQARGAQTASTLYGPSDLADQYIMISSIHFEDRWESPQTHATLRLVAFIDAVNGDREQTFMFTFQNGIWEPAY
ncbi:hypothetical protein K8R04_01465 [Candidatus Uhrbacteria bacterium]|nr:hypothetical protein [Candidatus Uhrbacteria bacterium]